MRAYEFINESFFFYKNYYDNNDYILIINDIKNTIKEIDRVITIYKTTRVRLKKQVVNLPELNNLLNKISLDLPKIEQELLENKKPDFKYAEFIIEKLTKIQIDFSTDMAYFKYAIEEKLRFNEKQEIIKKLYKLIQHVDTFLKQFIDIIYNVALKEKDI